jgi:hypothetical protein
VRRHDPSIASNFHRRDAESTEFGIRFISKTFPLAYSAPPQSQESGTYPTTVLPVKQISAGINQRELNRQGFLRIWALLISSGRFAILEYMDKTSNPAQPERSKMLRGELYSAMDPELVAARVRARRLFARYNASDPADITGRAALLRDLLGYVGPDAVIESPFYCDYGTQITLGAGVFVNFGAVFLDPAQITIGEQSQLGPYVQLLTADHRGMRPHARLGRNWRIRSTLARGSGLAAA